MSSRSPFLVNVTDVMRGRVVSQPIRIETPVAWSVDVSRIAMDPPLRTRMEMATAGRGVIVRGTITATAEHTCTRCLRVYEESAVVDVEQLFAEPGFDDEAEYLLDGDEIDLEPMVRDELLLAMPVVTSCGEDCPGLVGHSESDLNTGTPGDDDVSSPFSALRGILEAGDVT
ncbi:MAG: DUF177 domain-containing protein [Acidimicrobiia bacterium]